MKKSLQEQINKIKKSITSQNLSSDKIKTYNKLNEIEHSLYRRTQLSKAGLKDEARTERVRVNNLVNNFNNSEGGDDSEPLKGYISNTRYIWVAEDDACDACQALDGKEYDSPDDAPIPLHPNCKCSIEEFEEEESGESDEEPCDCVERLEALIQELEENYSDLESLDGEAQADSENVDTMASHVENMIEEMNEAIEFLGEEYGQHLADCENNIDVFYDEVLAMKKKLQNLLTDILDLLGTIKSYLEVLTIFISNFLQLLNKTYVLREEGMDKYYHSVANCQSAQLGEIEEESATVLSDKKELFDQYKNIYARTHKVSEEEALADSERDQIANRLGRERGRNNPTCDCHILM